MPKANAAHATPLYDQIVRALSEEPWGVDPDAELPATVPDAGEARQLARKIRRYKSDFPRYCAEVLRIRTKEGKLIPFRLKKAQLYVWHTHLEPAFAESKPVKLYLLKGRQIGFSTMTQAVQYWRMSLWPHLGGLTAAHSKSSAGNIYNMLRLFYRNAPRDFRPLQKHANRQELYFAHPKDEGDLGLESKITVATAADEDLGASYTLQMVHLSEFARYDQRSKDVDQIMATLLQAVPDNTASVVVAETTGEGDNFAADFWRRETFTNVFIPWVADERYTMHSPIPREEWAADPMSAWGDEVTAAGYIRKHLVEWWSDEAQDAEWLDHEVGCRLHWRRVVLKEKCNGKIHLFHKQYPLVPEEAFSGGGKSIFDARRLSIRLDRLRQDRAGAGWCLVPFGWLPTRPAGHRFGPVEAGDLRVYELPDPSHRYVIGVDVAIGHEDGDYSVAQVFKQGQGRHAGRWFQVATYQAHIGPTAFADLVIDLSEWYTRAFVVPESTGSGAAVIERLKDRQFANMFVREAMDSMGYDVVQKWGFHTSAHNKNLLVSTTQNLILHDAVQFSDEETIRELLAYTVDERGRLTAPKGKHDDLVMGTCLALYGASQLPAPAEARRVELSDFELFKQGYDNRTELTVRRPTVM